MCGNCVTALVDLVRLAQQAIRRFELHLQLPIDALIQNVPNCAHKASLCYMRRAGTVRPSLTVVHTAKRQPVRPKLERRGLENVVILVHMHLVRDDRQLFQGIAAHVGPVIDDDRRVVLPVRRELSSGFLVSTSGDDVDK